MSLENDFMGNQGSKYKNALEKILIEDGFVYGIVVPWGWTKGYANDIGANRVLNKESDFSVEKWTEIFCNCKAIGFNCVRIWLFEILEGIDFDENGDVLRVQEEFMINLESLLDIAFDLDINLEVTLQCHSSIVLATNIDHYNKYLQLQFDKRIRQHYIDRVVIPVCGLLKKYRKNIAAVQIFAEPEGDTSGPFGNRYQPYGSTWENIADHIRQVGAKVRELIPDVVITSSTGWQGFENLKRGNFNNLDLDIIGSDIYNDKGEVYYDTANVRQYESLSDLHLSKPVWISEFGLISNQNWSDELQTETTINMFKNAKAAGFQGAFLWMYGYPESRESLTIIGKNGNLRPVAVAIKYFLNDIRKERAKNNDGTVPCNLDIPTMVYSHDRYGIKWLGSRNAKYYKVERSLDKIKWDIAAKDLTPIIVDNGTGLCTFTDISAQTGIKYFYRVTVFDCNENSLVSEPSLWYKSEKINDIGALQPVGTPAVIVDYIFTKSIEPAEPNNLLSLNHGAEESFTVADWGNESFIVDGIISRTNETSYTGNYCIKFNADGTAGEKRAIRWVDIEKDKDYLFAFSAKATAYNDICLALIDETTQQSIKTTRILAESLASRCWDQRIASYPRLMPPAYDNYWHRRTISFHSGGQNKIGILVCGTYGTMYLDDFCMCLVENAIVDIEL